jgi:hypothetical protein
MNSKIMVKGSITCLVLLAAVNCAFNSSWVAAFTTTTRISNTPFGLYSVYHSARPSSQLSSLFTGKRRNLFTGTGRKNRIWEELPSNHVLEAIESLPRNSGNPQSKTATVADVATAVGISLAQAEKDCFLLAAALGASSKDQGNTFISVSNDGDLVFSFAAPVQDALQRASKAYRLRLYWEGRIRPTLVSLLRVGFDAAVYVSGTVVPLLALVGGGAPWIDLTLTGANVTLKYLGMYFLCLGSFRVLPSAYSYVFDGWNSKEQVRHRQLRMAATFIRSQGGAVIDKQLEPFLLRSTLGLGHASGSQVVSQFNGRPLVAESGDIVYVFQELMNTSERAGLVGASSADLSNVHSLLQEQEHKLLRVEGYRAFYQILIILCATIRVCSRGILSNRLYGIMVLFFFFPTMRYLHVTSENKAMQEWNKWRKDRHVAMASRPWRKRITQSTDGFRTKMKHIDVVDDMVIVKQESRRSHSPWFDGLWKHINTIQHPASKAALWKR